MPEWTLGPRDVADGEGDAATRARGSEPDSSGQEGSSAQPKIAAETPVLGRALLYVVDRTRQDIYQALTANFADAPDVKVILERRTGERRRLAAVATSPERRRGERRGLAGTDAIAQGDGWTLFRLWSQTT